MITQRTFSRQSRLAWCTWGLALLTEKTNLALGRGVAGAGPEMILIMGGDMSTNQLWLATAPGMGAPSLPTARTCPPPQEAYSL